MKTIQDVVQQINAALSSWMQAEKKPTPVKEEYSAESLWGMEKYNAVYSLEQQAYSISALNPQKYALAASQTYLEAAELAMRYTKDIADEEARKFLIENKILRLYACACSGYFKVITWPDYRKWHKLSSGIFIIYLNLEAKCAAMHLWLDKPDYYEFDIKSINTMNYILKKEYPPLKAGATFIKAAKKAANDGLPDILVLQLYNFALANMRDEFYGNNPSKEVVASYQDTINTSIEIASKHAHTEVGAQEFERLQQELRVMQDKLQIVDIVKNEIEFNPATTYLDLGLRGLNDSDIEKIVAIINRYPNLTGLNLNRTVRLSAGRDSSLSFTSSELENVFGTKGIISLARLRYVTRLDFGPPATIEDKAMQAVINSDLARLKVCLAELAKLNKIEELVKVINKCLLVAAAFGRVDISNYLLNSGADLNLMDEGLQRFAMFVAICAERSDVVLLLLKHILKNDTYLAQYREAALAIAIYIGEEKINKILDSLPGTSILSELRDKLDNLEHYLKDVHQESKESKESKDAEDFSQIQRWVAISENPYQAEILMLLDEIIKSLRILPEAAGSKEFMALCEWHDVIENLAGYLTIPKKAESVRKTPIIFSQSYDELRANGNSILALDEASVGLKYYQLGIGKITFG